MLNNGYVDSNNATESVTVADDPPVAQDSSISTTSDQTVSGQLQGSDPDNGQTLTYAVVALPTHGTVTLTDVNKGSYNYSPEAGYSGDDSFTFKVNDGYLDSNTATEKVTVSAAATGGSSPSTSGGSGGGAMGPWGLSVLALVVTLTRLGRRRFRTCAT